jgi:thiol-disulfide isomerase/thioredoxin
MATGNIARNEITGKFIKSEPPNQAYRDGWDNIFGKKNKLVLASASFCGPCKMLKSKIDAEGLTVEIKQMEDEIDFFKQHDIKSVPRLLVFKNDELLDTVRGPDQIIQRIKDELL